MEQPTAQEVVNDIFRLFHDLAPERAADLEQEFSVIRPTIILDEHETKQSFSANPELGIIRIGIPCLKLQLAMAFAYVIVYRERVRYARRTGAHNIPLDATPEVDKATSLLAWVMRERLRNVNLNPYHPGQDEDWPEDIPFPAPESPIDSDARIAIELYYVALGADLHHEFAHLRRGHVATVGANANAIEQEIEADELAAEWLLADVPSEAPEHDKRLLGIALSHLYDIFLKLEGFDSDKLHPPLINRLRNSLESYALDPNHNVWAFVAASLMLNLEMSGRREFNRDSTFPTYHDEVIYLLNVYARTGDR